MRFSILHSPFSILMRHRPRFSLLASRFSSRSGQLLVEALVAVSILTVGFLGVLTLLSRSLSLNRVISDNYTATYLAAEGVETMKNILDANAIQGRAWNDGFCNNAGAFRVDYSTTALGPARIGDGTVRDDQPLRFDGGGSFYQYGTGNETSFKRTVLVVCPSNNEVKINSIVQWLTRGGGSFEVNLEDHFFNWRG